MSLTALAALVGSMTRAPWALEEYGPHRETRAVSPRARGSRVEITDAIVFGDDARGIVALRNAAPALIAVAVAARAVAAGESRYRRPPPSMTRDDLLVLWDTLLDALDALDAALARLAPPEPED